MDPEESKQLKDLITAYRECKTANEERHLIQREKAIIRNSFIVKPHNLGKTRELPPEEHSQVDLDQHAWTRDRLRTGIIIKL